jgi:hypothetical protein
MRRRRSRRRHHRGDRLREEAGPGTAVHSIPVFALGDVEAIGRRLAAAEKIRALRPAL